MAENPLAGGPVGRGLIAHFEVFRVGPVDAVPMRTPNLGPDEVDYMLTFEDGAVAPYRITFSPDMKFNVLKALPLA